MSLIREDLSEDADLTECLFAPHSLLNFSHSHTHAEGFFFQSILLCMQVHKKANCLLMLCSGKQQQGISGFWGGITFLQILLQKDSKLGCQIKTKGLKQRKACHKGTELVTSSHDLILVCWSGVGTLHHLLLYDLTQPDRKIFAVTCNEHIHTHRFISYISIC